MATTTASRRDPVPAGIQKLTAASGIVFALLLIVTVSLSGDSTPDRDAALGEWTAYAKDNESNLRLAAMLFGFATYAFLIFIGVLRGALGQAEEAARGFTRASHMVFAGGLAGISGMAIGVFINAAAMSYSDTPPETLRAIAQLGGAGFGLGGAGFAAMLVSVGILNMRVPALPSWLGWLALVGGVAFLLTFGTLLSEEYDNAFGMFFPIAFLILMLFCLLASVSLIKRVGSPGPVASSSDDVL